MNAKNLVVQLDAEPASAQRFQLAAGLSKAQGARLAAVYTPRPFYVPKQVMAELGEMVVRDLKERQRAEIAQAEAQYAERANACGLLDMTFIAATGDPLQALTDHAMVADLVIVGQAAASGHDGPAVRSDFPESLAEAAGRPILVVPRDGVQAVPGKRVMIAWKPSPQAARAVGSALPLLLHAEAVEVVSLIDESEDDRGPAASDKLAGALQGHGIPATVVRIQRPRKSTGEVLLTKAAEMKADLIIAGCYSHSRLRERLLGGVSRTLLADSPVPVLMAG